MLFTHILKLASSHSASFTHVHYIMTRPSFFLSPIVQPDYFVHTRTRLLEYMENLSTTPRAFMPLDIVADFVACHCLVTTSPRLFVLGLLVRLLVFLTFLLFLLLPPPPHSFAAAYDFFSLFFPICFLFFLLLRLLLLPSYSALRLFFFLLCLG